MSVAANAAVALAILLLAIASLLSVVGFISWRRTGNAKLAWVTVALVALAIQGGITTRDMYQMRAEIATSGALPPFLVLDLAVVAAIYLAVLKR